MIHGDYNTNNILVRLRNKHATPETMTSFPVSSEAVTSAVVTSEVMSSSHRSSEVKPSSHVLSEVMPSSPVSSEVMSSSPVTSPYEIVGVIDFGDVRQCCYVYEVAISIAHLAKDNANADVGILGRHFLAGKINITTKDFSVKVNYLHSS